MFRCGIFLSKSKSDQVWLFEAIKNAVSQRCEWLAIQAHVHAMLI